MTNQITDFEKIVEQYAQKIAKEYGTSVKWTCIDGSQQHLKDQYPDKKVSVDVDDPVFMWDAPAAHQDLLYKDRVTNEGSSNVTTLVKRSEQVSNSFSWSTTEGIKVGTSVKVSVKGGFWGAESTQSFDMNFSSTQGQTETVVRTWEVNKTIITPPKTKTEISWLLNRDKTNGTYIADVTISGHVAIWFKDKIDLNHKGGKDLHWLWFPHPSSVIREMQPEGFRTSGTSVIFRATGKANADVGLESILNVNETAIDTKARQLEVPFHQMFVMDSHGEDIEDEILSDSE